MSFTQKKEKPTIAITKRAGVTAWGTTPIVITIKGINEKWIPYTGDIVIVNKPTMREWVKVKVILAIGLFRRDPRYRKYVENWINEINTRMEKKISQYKEDPWGFVEEIQMNQMGIEM